MLLSQASSHKSNRGVNIKVGVLKQRPQAESPSGTAKSFSSAYEARGGKEMKADRERSIFAGSQIESTYGGCVEG